MGQVAVTEEPPLKRRRHVSHSAGANGKSNWEIFDGYISGGGDLLVEDLTIKEAERKALLIEGCKGFTFCGRPVRGGTVCVYFKNKWDISRNFASTAGSLRWTSYRVMPLATSGPHSHEVQRSTPKKRSWDMPITIAEVGSKKAVIVGINYVGTNNELKGCINDAHAHQRLLVEHFGFLDSDITLLIDDPRCKNQPTARNIRSALEDMIGSASPCDTLFFGYSGHGSQIEDEDGDESDGLDEVLCPVDSVCNSWPEHIITDDWLHDVLIGRLPVGATLTCIMDCCHSGSVSDLPHLEDLNTAMEARCRTMASQSEGITRSTQCKKESSYHTKKVVFISACEDQQTSADITTEGRSHGAMTWSLLSILADADFSISHESLIERLREKVSRQFPQNPQLHVGNIESLSSLYLGGGERVGS
eukprot:TRINITY_DN21250_c0_g2_i1.p1 TRINITY_DN21250_c0_g2~~TRINITY_DN21250_c0_g2_i1.p1  ORF type:complete len:418 (-),score=42.16 TRINITY_DN21250_c0_g2_i1:8-1261(-)